MIFQCCKSATVSKTLTWSSRGEICRKRASDIHLGGRRRSISSYGSTSVTSQACFSAEGASPKTSPFRETHVDVPRSLHCSHTPASSQSSRRAVAYGLVSREGLTPPLGSSQAFRLVSNSTQNSGQQWTVLRSPQEVRSTFVQRRNTTPIYGILKSSGRPGSRV